jgi:hypothetical protein
VLSKWSTCYRYPAAYDVIYCTYQGKALNDSMNQLVINALTYYLTLREVATAESY